MSHHTLVGLWDLLGTDHITANSTFPIRDIRNKRSGESALPNDHRTLVASKDYGPGGKYRCIIKLQLRYEKQAEDDPRWAMGTGWLIRPDLLVTAGHCAYDWEHGDDGLGRVVRVKSYMGYNGKASIGDTGVQFRQGSRVVTTAGWLRGASNESSDVSFIQLEEPFDSIELSDCIPYVETPLKGSATLGVVGYPADKENKLGEKGAQMYEEFDPVSYDLMKNSDHMLHYEISTFAGQSGSPVLRKSNDKALVAIGTHVLGLGDNNAASPIGGKFGNPYKDYLAAFDRKNTVIHSILGVTFVRVLATDTINGGRDGTPGIGSISSMPSNPEDFFDVFKDVIKIGGTIAPDILVAGTPFLGPVGGPISGIAGMILRMAGKMAESGMETESSMQAGNFKEYASRAILGEAALQHVLKMDRETVQEFGLLDTIKTIYNKTRPFVENIAPKILPIVAEPALRIALDSIRKTKENKGEAELPPTRKRIQLPESSFPTSPESRDFLSSLISKPIPVADGQEGFFTSILSNGLSLVDTLTSTGLKILNAVQGREDAMPPTESEKNLILLSKRAAMGEAALQALMGIPKESLNNEGFLDVFSGVIGTIGAQIMKSGPAVIKAAAPLVRDLLKSKPGDSKKTIPTLKSQKSISLMDFMANNNGTRDSVDAGPSDKLGTGRPRKNDDGVFFTDGVSFTE